MRTAIFAAAFLTLVVGGIQASNSQTAASQNPAEQFFLASIFTVDSSEKQLIDSNHRNMSVFLLNGCWCDVKVYYYGSDHNVKLSITIAQRGVARIDAFSSVSAQAIGPGKTGDLSVVAFYTD
ncbi:MAG: hypothetical protein ACRD9W_06445 [Terriglobia bacterium]